MLSGRWGVGWGLQGKAGSSHGGHGPDRRQILALGWRLSPTPRIPQHPSTQRHPRRGVLALSLFRSQRRTERPPSSWASSQEPIAPCILGSSRQGPKENQTHFPSGFAHLLESSASLSGLGRRHRKERLEHRPTPAPLCPPLQGPPAAGLRAPTPEEPGTHLQGCSPVSAPQAPPRRKVPGLGESRYCDAERSAIGCLMTWVEPKVPEGLGGAQVGGTEGSRSGRITGGWRGRFQKARVPHGVSGAEDSRRSGRFTGVGPDLGLWSLLAGRPQSGGPEPRRRHQRSRRSPASDPATLGYRGLPDPT